MTKSLHKLGLIACAAKIIVGTIYYTSMDVAKETCVKPMVGKQTDKCPDNFERWSRPFFGSAVLFFGMSFMLIPFYLFRNGKPGIPRVDGKVVLNMLLPATLEFIGQVLFLMGLKKIPVALSLTLKGSRVAFSALFVLTFLKRKLRSYHWAAVLIVLIGLGIASIPEILEASDKAEKDKAAGKMKTDNSAGGVILGIILTLGGEFVRAFKGVLEEKFMKKLHYDAFMVVGLQGVLAFLWAVPTVSVADAIDVEHFVDTWSQFTYSPMVWGLLSLSPLTVSGLFLSGAYVTKLMSSVHNALTGSITTAIVWLLSILIYVINNKAGGIGRRGLEFKTIHLVQLLGFLIVVFASMMYDAMIRLPFFTYPADRAEASGAGTTAKTDPKDPDLVIDEDIRETAEAIGIKDDDLTVESDEEEQTTVFDDETSKMIDTSSPNMRRRT